MVPGRCQLPVSRTVGWEGVSPAPSGGKAGGSLRVTTCGGTGSSPGSPPPGTLPPHPGAPRRAPVGPGQGEATPAEAPSEQLAGAGGPGSRPVGWTHTLVPEVPLLLEVRRPRCQRHGALPFANVASTFPAAGVGPTCHLFG